MSALKLYTQLQRDLRKYVNMTSRCPLEHIEFSVLFPCVSNLIKCPHYVAHIGTTTNSRRCS
jgi:hypothetical protein